MYTTEELKTTLNLRDELEYKDGDVVAKNIVKNDNGSVTLLAFDYNAMIARHSVNADVLVYVVEGAVEFEVNDQRHKLDAGNAMVLPANTPHTVVALAKSKVLLTKLNA